MTRAAIAGVGYTEFSRASGRTVLSLAREAARAAIDDAGIATDAVDGVVGFSVMHDSVPSQAVATTLALPGARFLLDVDLGGQAPCYLTGLAAMAVTTGQADAVVVFRALNGRSGVRVGNMEFHGEGGAFRYPVGYDAYMMYVGMWAQRFLHETGQDADALANVAIAQRRAAERNERAVRRTPLDRDAYFAAPFIVEPYRVHDCTVEVDGACAILVTSLERARDLRQKPAVITSYEYRAGARSGLDLGDHLLWDDYTRNYTSWLRDDLFGRAGIVPSDVDFAEIYDCFTSTVLMSMEGLGVCDRGESGAFVGSGTTEVAGKLPVNTNGGLLSEGYLHGMNTVAEAVLQMQGRGGARQVARTDTCVVTSGALMDGSALVLQQDR